MTPLLKVLTEYCATYVDDIRLQELSIENPALYARKMSQYFIPSIALFSIPAEMQEYLVGNKYNPKFFEPIYDNKRVTTSGKQTKSFTIDLGEEYQGHELFSANILSLNGGKVKTTPTNICEYDSATGIIKVTASEENPIEDNTTFDFDFYTDGWFEEELSSQVMNILGICFQCVWQDRFNTDWLSNVAKVEDKSFYEQNRANKMNADTARLNQLRQKLAGEMRRFEQNLYYKKTVLGVDKLNIP